MARCAHATGSCSEEVSLTCDVINKTTPPPPREWDPHETVAVTLTREQWQRVAGWLSYGVAWNHSRMIWWSRFCDDKRMGAEKAAAYEKDAATAENLCHQIEEVLYGESEK